ncbi:hypothetical protein C8R46DRAFT_1239365 [Mycena filopes]|nr:hypothetical protein C8R46DRAFT_1239365 [Mycena filopes]
MGKQSNTKSDKRRAANRRYYEAHPQLREKNKARIAERRKIQMEYKRQWDPPKGHVLDEENISANDSQLSAVPNESFIGTETAAQAALSAMYHLHIGQVTPNLTVPAKEPRGLAEITAYESSDDMDSSPARTSRPLNDVTPSPAMGARRERDQAYERAQLEEERAHRLRVIVESSQSWQEVAAIHKERGSVGVEMWLKGQCNTPTDKGGRASRSPNYNQT